MLAEYSKAQPDDHQVKQSMDLTYSSQRLFINQKKPGVKKVCEEWPFLLQPVYLLSHFDILMGFDIVQRADSFFSEKGSAIFRYAKQSTNSNVRGTRQSFICCC
jgi:hypothetical protein